MTGKRKQTNHVIVLNEEAMICQRCLVKWARVTVHDRLLCSRCARKEARDAE